MILSFSTQINKKPTYFVEKILLGINKHLGVYHTESFLKDYQKKFGRNPPVNYNSKIHTIRLDPKERWKKGNKIDFFINCRQKNMFRFAPVLPVVSVQKVFMMYSYNNLIRILIDGKEVYSYYDRLELAQNDGFDGWDDFFDYFYPLVKASEDGVLKMKLIHWTDKKY